jgi:prolyl oligopeptidase
MKWKYPVSKVDPVVDDLHGYKVIDNYRWLEDGDNSEVKKWVAEQNKFSATTIEENGDFDIFQDELAEQFDETMFTVPCRMKNGIYIWMERQPGQNQSVIYIKDTLDGEPRVLVDPNTMKADGTVSLDYWRPSVNGTYLAYGISEGGSEIATMRIKAISSGKDLDDEIQNASHSSVSWLPDESGFYYTRNPKPNTLPKGEELYYYKVYQHLLGDESDKDKLIFGEGRPKDDLLGLSLTMDGRYLCIYASQDWNRNDLYMYNTQTGQTVTIVEGIDAKFNLSSTSDKYLMKTNYKAENGRILTAPLGPVPKTIDDWQEFIPETKDILTGFNTTADKILVCYMVNATSEVKIFDYNGNEQDKLPLPSFSSINGLGCSRWSKEYFYGVTGFFSQIVVYRYDPETDKHSVYRKHDNIPLDPDYYIVKQEWITSKDGTKLPMFIMHHKDIKPDGSNPTVLYGYGCHGTSETPGFMRSFIPWFKRGGVYAIANIRGGGEYGEQWHRDGSMEKKQNTFDDFIAAAEYLIDTKITSPKRLGIMGGSNGGLMVGAVMTQRPELFKAVVCRVPVLDLYRYHKFLIAGRWVHEFGNPEKANEFEWLRKWSPYHHVKPGVEYPNAMFVTANKDTRVAPLHAWKMTALLQATNKENVVLLRTEMDAGHGPGKPVKKFVESQAYALAFLAWELSLRP